ncbi:alpha/beta fold hydrolase [Sinorhizobium meliloti]|uniref:alpha/beta fold hydrolase n=1 Tax=Rhizobium meliloti TaxID=382 RepID=UPI0034E54CC9
MQRSRKVTLSFAGGWAAARHFERRMGGRGPRVLVAHGWGSRSDYLATLIDGLLSSGAEVVALDLPGHGASPGRTLTMPQAVRAIDAAWRHFDGFDVGIGHSFGGASLACAAGAVLCDVPARVPGKLVLIGAPSEMTWLFKGLRPDGGARAEGAGSFRGHGGAALRASHRRFRCHPHPGGTPQAGSGHPCRGRQGSPCRSRAPLRRCRTKCRIALGERSRASPHRFRRSGHREDHGIPLGAQERGSHVKNRLMASSGRHAIPRNGAQRSRFSAWQP